MDREILFRGKQIDNGEWMEGSVLRSGNGCVDIVPLNNSICEDKYGGLCAMKWREVDPETVCQYTGLTDKNGNKIFEGDILSHDSVGNVEVQFEKSEFLAIGISHNMFSTLLSLIYKDCKVIGNIFDNPELLISAVEHPEKHKATYEWIPCSERLPEEDGFYQVTVQIKETGECYVEKKYYKIKKGWDSYLAREFIDVIAWMPLPDPYRSALN